MKSEENEGDTNGYVENGRPDPLDGIKIQEKKLEEANGKTCSDLKEVLSESNNSDVSNGSRKKCKIESYYIAIALFLGCGLLGVLVYFTVRNTLDNEMPVINNYDDGSQDQRVRLQVTTETMQTTTEKGGSCLTMQVQCSNNGICLTEKNETGTYGVCSCFKPYIGDDCSELFKTDILNIVQISLVPSPRELMWAESDCQRNCSRGICRRVNLSTFECQPSSCSENPNLCSNQGTCTDVNATAYECNCTKGFGGKDCSRVLPDLTDKSKLFRRTGLVAPNGFSHSLRLTTSTSAPTTSTSSPATSTLLPTTPASNPVTSTPAPTTTTSSSATSTSVHTTSTPSPVTSTFAPTTLTSSPATSTPAPTTSTSNPTTSTLDPTTTTGSDKRK